MNDFAARLRAERTRLKMTQEGFARGCGVARRAQAAYEAGERVPDANYLMLAAKAGVDTAYVLTGVGAGRDLLARVYLDRLLRAIAVELQIPDAVIDRGLAEVWAGVVAENRAEPLGATGAEAFVSGVAARLLQRSQRLVANEVVLTLDRDTLVRIISGLETAWRETERRVTPLDKAHAIASLYREFVVSGEVDDGLIRGGASSTPYR